MDENEIKIIKRGRGTVLLEGGHQYYFHKKYKNESAIWRCKQYKLDVKCTGSVTLSKVGNDFLFITYIFYKLILFDYIFQTRVKTASLCFRTKMLLLIKSHIVNSANLTLP